MFMTISVPNFSCPAPTVNDLLLLKPKVEEKFCTSALLLLHITQENYSDDRFSEKQWVWNGVHSS
jgi:hypothetical protein